VKVDRRHFAKIVAGAGAAIAMDRWLEALTVQPISGGRLVRTMPLGRFDGRPAPPLNTLLGTSLDARQFADLSRVDRDHPLTPSDQFYIRTAHPPALPPADKWRIQVGGLVPQERSIDLASLQTESRAMGAHVMECSGNVDPANFGLLSAATWDGVPVSELLDRLGRPAGAQRVQITGFDDEGFRSASSNAGASWIFTAEELERTKAFLALRMNDAPLTADHGAPVRLVVPNYYGCSCIKWSSRIDWVADNEPTTLQMREFSARTHQRGVPLVARDYEPPVIDLAAAPIRVEQWTTTREGRERIVYRVVGLRWGGNVVNAPLTIRFKHTERFVPVEDNPPAASPTSWTLWSHTWTPDAPGRYQITLSVSDPSIRARRLDIFYYTRDVEIDRV
jgi:DMSO/TMAO reductase YedYZ molybdopterin-dependent catalytic subunit